MKIYIQEEINIEVYMYNLFIISSVAARGSHITVVNTRPQDTKSNCLTKPVP